MTLIFWIIFLLYMISFNLIILEMEHNVRNR